MKLLCFQLPTFLLLFVSFGISISYTAALWKKLNKFEFSSTWKVLVWKWRDSNLPVFHPLVESANVYMNQDWAWPTPRMQNSIWVSQLHSRSPRTWAVFAASLDALTASLVGSKIAGMWTGILIWMWNSMATCCTIMAAPMFPLRISKIYEFIDTRKYYLILSRIN